MAAILDTTASGGLYLEVPRVVAVYLVNTVFFEKQRITQMRDRSSEGAIRTSGCSIAVGRQTHKAVPVAEIAQFAGVNLIDHLAVISFAV